MAITVKHKFVSAIPDAGDTSVVQPSNWNDDHQLTGTVPIANGGTGASDASTALTNLGAYPASNPSGYGTGTVTNVTGTSPVNVATGTSTPVISLSSTGSGNVVLATGATQSHPTISDYEAFTPTTAPSYVEGEIWYDSTQKALTYYNDVTNNQVHIGQEVQLKVINNTGSSIANGTPVYVTGTSSGQSYPNIALAKADAANTSAVLGLTNGTIASGAVGYVCTAGLLTPCNTGSFTVGQVLYLSPYSAGQLQNTIPPTGYAVQVGVVAYANTPNGAIYVKQTTPLAVSASIIVGQVALSNGGTNANLTASAGSVPYSTSTALALSAVGTSGQVLTSAGTGAPTWTTPTTGTVTSVAATVPTFLSVTGSPITSSGTLAISLSGTALPVANGGTGATTLAGASIVTYTGTETLTNKRINLRILSQTSVSSLAINSDSYDQAVLTAQAVSLSVPAPTGTPVNGQKLTIRIKDNGGAQTISWTITSGGWRVMGVTLPTTTVASKVVYVGAIYNSDESFWDVVSVAQQA
jgi:hypothetical protein